MLFWSFRAIIHSAVGVGVAAELPYLSHWDVDQDPIHARRRPNSAIPGLVLPSEIRLSDLNRDGKGGVKGGGSAGIAFTECL